MNYFGFLFARSVRPLHAARARFLWLFVAALLLPFAASLSRNSEGGTRAERLDTSILSLSSEEFPGSRE